MVNSSVETTLLWGSMPLNMLDIVEVLADGQVQEQCNMNAPKCHALFT